MNKRHIVKGMSGIGKPRPKRTSSTTTTANIAKAPLTVTAANASTQFKDLVADIQSKNPRLKYRDAWNRAKADPVGATLYELMESKKS